MSSNNQLTITQEEGIFIVNDIDVESEFINLKLGKFLTLEDAIKASYKYLRDNEVEYGLNVKL